MIVMSIDGDLLFISVLAHAPMSEGQTHSEEDWEERISTNHQQNETNHHERRFCHLHEPRFDETGVVECADDVEQSETKGPFVRERCEPNREREEDVEEEPVKEAAEDDDEADVDLLIGVGKTVFVHDSLTEGDE